MQTLAVLSAVAVNPKVKEVRGATNKWVAKYRRDGAFQGKSSFG